MRKFFAILGDVGYAKPAERKKHNFLQVLAEQGNVFRACEAAGINRGWAYEFRAKDAAFREEWDKALEDAADRMESEAWRRAMKGTERPIFHKGEEVGLVRDYSDLLLIFMLKGIRPEKFRDSYAARDQPPQPINQFFVNLPPDIITTVAAKARELETQARDITPCDDALLDE